MGKLINKHLKGSTLIEVITASIMFLIVFGVSFSTLSGLVPADNNALELIEADYRVSTIFRELSDGLHQDGKYDTQHSWGKISAILESYSDYSGLQQLSITVTFHNNRKGIISRYVVERFQ